LPALNTDYDRIETSSSMLSIFFFILLNTDYDRIETS